METVVRKRELNIDVEKAVIELLHIVLKSDEKEIRLDNCVESGYAVVDEKGCPVRCITENAYQILDREYTYNTRVFNNTFHKNFYLTRHMSESDYYRDQILHYFSTYGLESLGFKVNPYIPFEELNIGEYKHKNLVIYVALDKEKYDERIRNFIINITAPRFDKIKYLNDLLRYSDVKIEDLKSFEIKCLYYDANDILPKSPIDFLRYMIYETTSQTLIIKNRDTIAAIKSGANIRIAKRTSTSFLKANIYKYFEKMDLKDLASIFHRYKPLFLAFKCYDNMPRIINKIRKLANKYHKPLSDICVQNIINIARKGNRWRDFNYILYNMSNADIFKCINCLNNTSGIKAYTIRNNKTFVSKNNNNSNTNSDILRAFKNELKRRLSSNFNNKTFILPSYMEYAVPTSEKQMLHNIPYGSYVKLGTDNMTLGIAWNNVEKEGNDGRVDIDLHLFSKSEHLGWNSDRMNADAVYTGDMTDATNGAAEAYWLNKTDTDYIATCNLYSGDYQDVSFKFFATKVKPDHFNRDYTYDPSKEMFPALNLKFDQNFSLNLGLYTDGKFYFYGNSISSGIVPAGNYENFIDALKGKLESTLTLSKLITMLGGKIAYDKSDDKTAINLLPENIACDTFTTLLK